MSLLDFVRPELAGMRPYGAAEQVDDTIRLNANESPWPTAADRFRRPLNRYPEVRPHGLRGQLAERFGCRSEQLLVTRGSSEAIDLLIRVFCRAGRDRILIAEPTFSMYAHYAAVQDAAVDVIELERDADFALTAGQVTPALTENTRLLFLCSPNNPTGTSIPRDSLRAILDATQDRCAVVLDEAYIEFSDAGSAVDLLEDYEHLVILRTLSKALGFAGARCGAIIAAAELIDVLDAVQAPYALATPVVECVEDALASEAVRQAEDGISLLVSERERLREALVAMPAVVRVWPSDANFLLVAVEDADALQRSAQDAKLLLRHYGGKLADCLRISIGTPEENDRLLSLIENAGRRA